LENLESNVLFPVPGNVIEFDQIRIFPGKNIAWKKSPRINIKPVEEYRYSLDSSC